MTCLDHGLKGNKPGGYHQVRIAGKLQYVHRLAYAAYNKLRVESVTLVRHLCNNPRCINPDHLAEGTHQDNANDRVAAGRSAKKVPSRAVLTLEQAREVRVLYATKQTYHGYPSILDLATKFGVAVTVISAAVKHKGAYEAA